MTTTNTANTILAQLGGAARLSAMIGAKNFLSVMADHGLQFRCKAGKSGINSVRVTLETSDTYRVEFWAIRNLNLRNVSAVEGVTVDALRETIEQATGLYLSLGTMGRR